MPSPLSLPLRQQILARFQLGRLPADIAAELRLPPRTVRRLCQQFRERGPAALATCYHPPPSSPPGPALLQALQLHELHPRWGAAYILVELRRQQPQLTDLPSERTLQRRFQEQQLPPAPSGRKPAGQRTRATRTHAVWQMDAVEQCPLKTAQQISWLRWVDEYCGAALGT